MTDAMTTWDVEYVILGRHFKDEKVFEARTETQARFKAKQHVDAILQSLSDEDPIRVTPAAKPKKSKSRRRSAPAGVEKVNHT